MILWHTLATYFRRKFGKRVQKIPLDRGASCPNRDGTLSKTGCLFCNAQGAGSGLLQRGLSIEKQWDFWQSKYQKTDANRDFLAYFQSFSNTYGPAHELQNLVQSVATLPNSIGLAIGTRPDCIDEQKIDILVNSGIDELWLELGLQSCHEQSLMSINRQHSVADSEQAVLMAAKRGIKVCAHLMAGLPGETAEDFLQSVRWAVSLPISGLKLHSLYVCNNSPLEHLYKQGRYKPLSMDAYINILTKSLPLIPTHIVMHRLTGDPAPEECLAPTWALHKRKVFTALYHEMRRENVWQGSLMDARDMRPEWFGR